MDPTTRNDPRGTGPSSPGDVTPISTSRDSEALLRSLVERKGAGIRVRVDGASELDVSGHALGGGELTLTILDGEDDTEGHAISLHFPSLEEAKRFQQRMVLTGAVVGTLVIAGTGLALSQALPNASTGGDVQAQVQVEAAQGATAGSQAWADTNFGSNLANAVGAPTTGGQAAADEGYGAGAATAGSQAWADTGFGADLSNAVADPTTGGQAAADEGYGAGAATAGSQAWADEGFGADLSNAVADPTTGGQAAADESYAGSDADDPDTGGTRLGPQPR